MKPDRYEVLPIPAPITTTCQYRGGNTTAYRIDNGQLPLQAQQRAQRAVAGVMSARAVVRRGVWQAPVAVLGLLVLAEGRHLRGLTYPEHCLPAADACPYIVAGTGDHHSLSK
jgi:hypothetical protein